MKKYCLIALALPFFYACTKEEKSNANPDIIEYHEGEQKETPVDQSAKAINQIAIKANEDMTYSVNQFVVKQGEEITLTLVNAGTSSKEAMGHNLVILKQGVDLSDFLFDASSEKENDYIPKDKPNDMVVYTKLLGPKESDQIKFTLDQKGTYTFVCTFPGHAGTMQGKITVI
ncbi:MAG TPA: plastocyanin/azurin family copper-binding protein [Faecalibacter sp.]